MSEAYVLLNIAEIIPLGLPIVNVTRVICPCSVGRKPALKVLGISISTKLALESTTATMQIITIVFVFIFFTNARVSLHWKESKLMFMNLESSSRN
jgi:hypothetical protein